MMPVDIALAVAFARAKAPDERNAAESALVEYDDRAVAYWAARHEYRYGPEQGTQVIKSRYLDAKIALRDCSPTGTAIRRITDERAADERIVAGLSRLGADLEPPMGWQANVLRKVEAPKPKRGWRWWRK